MECDYDKNKERKVWKSICHKYRCDINVSAINIQVRKSPSFQFNRNLPNCPSLFALKEADSSKAAASATGYFEKQQWKSLTCQNIKFTNAFQSFPTCFLKNKVVYMLGDSTMREIFLLTAKKFNLRVIEPAAPTAWQRPRVAYDANEALQNFRIYYRAHGPPLKSPGPPFTRPFVSDIISNILIGGKDVYVVFTIGIHFHEINPDLFMSRLKQIYIAILYHHKMFSETKFIIKGMSVVEPADFWDWTLYRYEIILREYFKGLNNVLFVNLWDLTTIWPLHEDVHAPSQILDQEWLLLFSYICN